MSEFFESDIVRGELEEIERLQSEIHGDLFAFPALPHDEQKEHLVNLVALVEKQRVLYTRICLSEDEDAKAMKEKIEQSALMMGFSDQVSVMQMFDGMIRSIQNILDSPPYSNEPV
jgi:hypothetical protein|tara:strand:- start:700 stop:1047 length:348 start_codon:yes stop_codon:yes gene_type:complete